MSDQTEREARYQRAVEDGGFLLGWEGCANSVRPIIALADQEQAELLERSNAAVDRARMLQAQAEDAEDAAQERLRAVEALADEWENAPNPSAALRGHTARLRAALASPVESDAEGGARCHGQRDGECHWEHCPQLRDGEPAKSGRHCPIDAPDLDR